jgi:hypothetical protein
MRSILHLRPFTVAVSHCIYIAGSVLWFRDTFSHQSVSFGCHLHRSHDLLFRAMFFIVSLALQQYAYGDVLQSISVCTDSSFILVLFSDVECLQS